VTLDNNWGPEFNYDYRRKPGHLLLLEQILSAITVRFGFRNIILTVSATMQHGKSPTMIFCGEFVQQAKVKRLA